jgi:quinol monooxygenase YgiN
MHRTGSYRTSQEVIVSEPFIFINTYAIKSGKEEEYRKAFQEILELVEANEPKMLYFGTHISEDGSQVTTLQVHADADNMVFHMQLAEDHIHAAMQNLIDASDMSIRIYGQPTEAVMAGMRELAGSGVQVTVSPAAAAFDRFADL